MVCRLNISADLQFNIHMNLEPETRNGYFISADKKKVWAVEMQLLKKLLEMCEKHNLRIWAEGGTLLGAIRHHGYIPWDDDIDMAMPREDYDKLQVFAKKEFKEPYFFQSGFTDIFPNGMTRLRMNDTTAILPQTLFQKCHQGIFIDIFPLDVVPDDDIVFKRLLERREKEKEKMMFYSSNHFSFTNLKYDWIVLKAKIEIGIIGFHSYFFKYDNTVKQFSKTQNKRVSIFSWLYDKKYLREKKWYSDTLHMPFENIMIPVPKDYDKILTTQYGEYMKPVKEPTMHGSYLALDAERSYKEYLPKLRNKHRWDGLREWMKKIGIKNNK